MASVQKVNKVEFTSGASTAIPATIGGVNGNRTVLTFEATQRTAGTTPSDIYGRFLKDFAPLPVTAPAARRGSRAVRAYDRIFAGASVGTIKQGIFLYHDFISGSGDPNTEGDINPVTFTRFFRVRTVIKRAITASLFGATTAGFHVYADRQHSIEV